MADYNSGKDWNKELCEKTMRVSVQGGDLKEVTSTSELQRILECPICKGVPLPPIFNCNKGHIICGKCHQQMNICGLCQSSFSDSRNYVLEEIVLTSKIACEFREQGCKFILSGAEFQNHADHCEFRPLRCFQGEFESCKHTIVDFQNYTKHLATVHKMVQQKHKNGSFAITHSLTDSRIKNTTWTGMFVYFEDKTFITRTFLRSDVLHLTLCLIGSDVEAGNYKVRLQFKRAGANETEFVPFEVTIPVTPIRKSYEEISKDCLHCMMTKSMIKSFCRIDDMPEKKQKLKWNVEYKILGNSSKNWLNDLNKK